MVRRSSQRRPEIAWEKNMIGENEEMGSLISDSELLIIREAMTRGSVSFSVNELERVVRWAERVVLRWTTFQLLMKGLLVVRWDEEAGAPRFTAVVGEDVVH